MRRSSHDMRCVMGMFDASLEARAGTSAEVTPFVEWWLSLSAEAINALGQYPRQVVWSAQAPWPSASWLETPPSPPAETGDASQ